MDYSVIDYINAAKDIESLEDEILRVVLNDALIVEVERVFDLVQEEEPDPPA